MPCSQYDLIFFLDFKLENQTCRSMLLYKIQLNEEEEAEDGEETADEN